MNMAIPADSSWPIRTANPALEASSLRAISLPVEAQSAQPVLPSEDGSTATRFAEAAFSPVDPSVRAPAAEIEKFETFLQRLHAPADTGYISLEEAHLKDGLSQFLNQLGTQLAERPELREQLGQNPAGKGLLEALDSAASGQLDSAAIVKLQTFVVASDVDIGYSDNRLGIDGDYGPLTHQGLQQAFVQLLANPEQSLAGLNERGAGIVQEVHDSRPVISDIVPSVGADETEGALISTPFQDKNGNQIRLKPSAAEGLSRIYELARARGIDVRVNSSYRSVEEQTRLWRDALNKYGSAEAARKWVAPPGRSRHNSGEAIDMNLMRNGQKIPQSEFDEIMRQAGMYRPMSWETWHVEPLGSRRA